MATLSYLTLDKQLLRRFLGDIYSETGLNFVVGGSSVSGLTFVLKITPTRTLFFYGTLTDPETLRIILSLPPKETPVLIPASLADEQWDSKQWMHYSYAFGSQAAGDAPGSTRTVRGCLYQCSVAQLSLLREYETSYYGLSNVQVLDDSERVVNASCFVWNTSAESGDPALGE